MNQVEIRLHALKLAAQIVGFTNFKGAKGSAQMSLEVMAVARDIEKFIYEIAVIRKAESATVNEEAHT